ncbi:RNA polymerase sigma factor [Proteiniphilum acetatigenes]|uniref:RNA polymerase sigma factor n=1 Tax=Proteiniphilum acetatigenes TaxID=294710 RepID=UPI0003601CFD|nr:sigma-70 family RNA polymerase sigma factor [Proteiniphilum acetatigenes]
MQTTDEILLKAIEEKDEKAFSRFYERYGSTILCFVLSKVHNKEIAKEIIQNFWVAFWENPRIIRANKEGCVKVFLLQYLRFRIYDVYRIAVPETIPVEDAELLADTTVYNNMEKEELKGIVYNALKNSSSLTKNSFWMRVESIPAKEVANELGVTTQTVHNKFSQSLAIIRKYIKTHYPEILKAKGRMKEHEI